MWTISMIRSASISNAVPLVWFSPGSMIIKLPRLMSVCPKKYKEEERPEPNPFVYPVLGLSHRCLSSVKPLYKKCMNVTHQFCPLSLCLALFSSEWKGKQKYLGGKHKKILVMAHTYKLIPCKLSQSKLFRCMLTCKNTTLKQVGRYN